MPLRHFGEARLLNQTGKRTGIAGSIVHGTVDDDLRLSSSSGLIDSGNPTADSSVSGPLDLEGTPRILCGRVEMGAFEFGVGNYSCDRTVNLSDYAGWPTCMTGPQVP